MSIKKLGLMPKKILLVDDEESIRNSLSDALNTFGYEVIQGHNGEDAIKLFDKEKPDLILLDVRLPIKSGLEAYTEIVKKHNNAKIEIIDSGPGIAKENLAKIFEPLFTTKSMGTGLGLVSCKNIVEHHHGKISVKNNPTTFTIEIPIKQ